MTEAIDDSIRVDKALALYGTQTRLREKQHARKRERHKKKEDREKTEHRAACYPRGGRGEGGSYSEQKEEGASSDALSHEEFV